MHDVTQDSSATVLSGSTPRLARDIIDQSMSPFCPGLSLAACPSPSADSLRNAIVARVRAGETRDVILKRLYTDFGTSIRGATDFSGSGLILWLAPGLFLLLGGIVVTIWLRRKAVQRRRSPATQSMLHPATTVANTATLDDFSDTERRRLAEILRRDRAR